MDIQNSGTEFDKDILEELEKLEVKLNGLLNFYYELAWLDQRRKSLVETLLNPEPEEKQEKFTLKKTVTINLDDEQRTSSIRRKSKIGSTLEKTKSVAQIYDLLGNLSSYHVDVNSRINELRDVKDKNPPDGGHLEIDTILEQLQEEKDELDSKIIQFVIKNIVEGKDEFFSIIAILEEDNKEMEDTIMMLEDRVEFLKETVIGLMRENQKLKLGDADGRPQSIIIRKSLMENMSLIFPTYLLKSNISADSDEDIEDFGSFTYFFGDKDEVSETTGTTKDSFELDADLADWPTDEESIEKMVKRIGADFEEMEVTQMKLNMLKAYVQRHGAKQINRDTLIDPSKGMSLWHSK